MLIHRSILDPACIIIKCQLPLFLAEIHSLEKPRGSASDIFTLYEITGKLLDLWDDLSFEQDHGFDLDGFFEPHVRAWLKDTEANRVGQWVERSVGMDSVSVSYVRLMLQLTIRVVGPRGRKQTQSISH